PALRDRVWPVRWRLRNERRALALQTDEACSLVHSSLRRRARIRHAATATTAPVAAPPAVPRSWKTPEANRTCAQPRHTTIRATHWIRAKNRVTGPPRACP